MYFGRRKVRTAGRASGSIEITLPVALQVLEGVDCLLIVRDGPKPEVVLQPDLSGAHALLHELWQKVRLGLGEIDDVGDFSLGDFLLGLFLPRHWQDRPPLAYADALAVLHERAGGSSKHPGALARLVALLAVAAAYRLDLRAPLALAFGDSVAYLVTGIPAGLGTDFERGMAYQAFWGDNGVRSTGSPFSDDVWQAIRPGLKRVYDRFRIWQENPETYTAARARWYTALTVEIGVAVSSLEDHMEPHPSTGM